MPDIRGFSSIDHLKIDMTAPHLQHNKADVSSIDTRVWEHFKKDLTPEDLDASIDEIDSSIREMTKAYIMELRAMAQPNQLVELTLQIVCALRGFKSLSWATARELLGKPSLKIELRQVSPTADGHLGSLRPDDVLRA